MWATANLIVTLDEDDAVETVLGQEHTLEGRALTVRRASKKASLSMDSANLQ